MARRERNKLNDSAGRKRAGQAGGRGNQRHAAANQVVDQSRKLLELAFQPVVLHQDILAIDVTVFLKAGGECQQIARGGGWWRTGGDEPDDRQRAAA